MNESVLDVRSLSLSGVAHRCAQETEAFFCRQLHDSSYCFELFRRAILDRNARAVELLFSQYRPLVNGWVQRHPAFPTSGEEAQYFVNRAFEKLWSALTPEKFGHFSDLKAVLRYFQMCVHSAILDHLRRYSSEQSMAAGADDEDAELADRRAPGVENVALDRASWEEFWRYVAGQLNGEKERLVVFGCFVQELRPRELCTEYSGVFVDVHEVYRVKQNVIERLRRDPNLRKLFTKNA